MSDQVANREQQSLILKEKLKELRAYAWSEAKRHKLPFFILIALLLCPKLLLVWVPLVAIWSACEYVVPRLPLVIRSKLTKCIPNRWRASRWFHELSAGVAQVRPFMLISAFLFCIPFALIWMYFRWIRSLCGWSKTTPVKPSLLGDSLLISQNKRDNEEEEECNFFHSPAFTITAVFLFVCGLPAAVTYALYSVLGVDSMLGSPSLDPNFKTVFIIIHLYLFSLGWCFSVLFFRSWFAFPVNFFGNDFYVEMTKDRVRKHLTSWLTQALTWNAPWSGADVLEWSDVKTIQLQTRTPLYPLPRVGIIADQPALYAVMNKVAAAIDGIARRSKYDEMLVLSTAAELNEVGSNIAINLDQLDGNERACLYYSIRTWAPHAIIDPRLQEQMVGSRVLQAPQYTQLWFELLTDKMPRKHAGALPPGVVLKEGVFTVEHRLSSGGQANVYLARTEEGAKVVLKEFILSNSDAVGAMVESAGEFETECTLLTELQHPRIIRMIDFFAEDRRLYLVIEKAPGNSLRSLIKNGGVALGERETIETALQICEVLEYLHSQEPPVVHRDISPDNLIFDEMSGIKVIDFSLAAGKKTRRTTSTMGKHSYAPPEQLREQPCPQSDIYALGATMYFLLTGEDPKPITQSDVRSKIPEINQRLNEIIRQSTAFDLETRYAEIKWMKLDLEALLDEFAPLEAALSA